MAHPARPSRDLTEAEWKVMHAVWAAAGSVSAREVLVRLGASTTWAYTTVKTLLDRLVEKGALCEIRGAKADRYEAATPRTQARRTAVRALLSRAFDGAVGPLIHHLLGEERLGAADRRALERLRDQDAARRKTP